MEVFAVIAAIIGGLSAAAGTAYSIYKSENYEPPPIAFANPPGAINAAEQKLAQIQNMSLNEAAAAATADLPVETGLSAVEPMEILKWLGVALALFVGYRILKKMKIV